MSFLSALPELGVGLVFMPGLGPLIKSAPGAIDFSKWNLSSIGSMPPNRPHNIGWTCVYSMRCRIWFRAT